MKYNVIRNNKTSKKKSLNRILGSTFVVLFIGLKIPFISYWAEHVIILLGTCYSFHIFYLGDENGNGYVITNSYAL